MLPVFALLTLFVAASSAQLRAVAVLTGPGVKGNITFVQLTNKPVSVEGTIEGLKAGYHGFHIHEKGDLTSGCASMAGHFNPHKKNHGGPKDQERHVGDLGNIQADENGIAHIVISDSLISLQGVNNIIGRGVVVHSDADDLGKGGFSDSLTTGHAGSRVACGVIGTMQMENLVSGATSLSFSFVPLTFILLILSHIF